VTRPHRGHQVFHVKRGVPRSLGNHSTKRLTLSNPDARPRPRRCVERSRHPARAADSRPAARSVFDRAVIQIARPMLSTTRRSRAEHPVRSDRLRQLRCWQTSRSLLSKRCLSWRRGETAWPVATLHPRGAFLRPGSAARSQGDGKPYLAEAVPQCQRAPKFNMAFACARPRGLPRPRRSSSEPFDGLVRGLSALTPAPLVSPLQLADCFASKGWQPFRDGRPARPILRSRRNLALVSRETDKYCVYLL